MIDQIMSYSVKISALGVLPVEMLDAFCFWIATCLQRFLQKGKIDNAAVLLLSLDVKPVFTQNKPTATLRCSAVSFTWKRQLVKPKT